jgi:hypothetical protein
MGIGFPLSLLPSTAVSRLCSEWCHLRKPSAPQKSSPLSEVSRDVGEEERVTVNQSRDKVVGSPEFERRQAALARPACPTQLTGDPLLYLPLQFWR